MSDQSYFAFLIHILLVDGKVLHSLQDRTHLGLLYDMGEVISVLCSSSSVLVETLLKVVNYYCIFM